MTGINALNLFFLAGAVLLASSVHSNAFLAQSKDDDGYTVSADNFTIGLFSAENDSSTDKAPEKIENGDQPTTNLPVIVTTTDENLNVTHNGIMLYDIVNCSLANGNCSTENKTDEKYLNNSSASSEAQQPKTFSDVVDLFEKMWKHPPMDKNAVLWHAFLGSTIAFVVLAMVMTGAYLAWMCLKHWQAHRVNQMSGANGFTKTVRGKRLVLVLPQGREFPTDEYVIDCTGAEPRAVFMPKAGTYHIQGPPVTRDRVIIPLPRSNSSSLANMLNVTDGETPNLPRHRSTPDTGNFSGNGYSNEAFSISSAESMIEVPVDVETYPVDLSDEDCAQTSASKLQRTEGMSMKELPSITGQQQELKTVKEEDEIEEDETQM